MKSAFHSGLEKVAEAEATIEQRRRELAAVRERMTEAQKRRVELVHELRKACPHPAYSTGPVEAIIPGATGFRVCLVCGADMSGG